MCTNMGRASARIERNKRINASNSLPDANAPIINAAIASGEIRDVINGDLQRDHIEGGERSARGYIYGSIELYRKYRGTGRLIMNNKTGEWTKKERVVCNEIVGVFDGVETNKLIIVYSVTGCHLYPRKTGGVD